MKHDELIVLARDRWPAVSDEATKIVPVHRNAFWFVDQERAPRGEKVCLEYWTAPDGTELGMGYSEASDILTVAVSLVDPIVGTGTREDR